MLERVASRLRIQRLDAPDIWLPFSFESWPAFAANTLLELDVLDRKISAVELNYDQLAAYSSTFANVPIEECKIRLRTDQTRIKEVASEIRRALKPNVWFGYVSTSSFARLKAACLNQEFLAMRARMDREAVRLEHRLNLYRERELIDRSATSELQKSARRNADE